MASPDKFNEITAKLPDLPMEWFDQGLETDFPHINPASGLANIILEILQKLGTAQDEYEHYQDNANVTNPNLWEEELTETALKIDALNECGYLFCVFYESVEEALDAPVKALPDATIETLMDREKVYQLAIEKTQAELAAETDESHQRYLQEIALFYALESHKHFQADA